MALKMSLVAKLGLLMSLSCHAGSPSKLSQLTLALEKSCNKKDAVACLKLAEMTSRLPGGSALAESYARKSCDLNSGLGCLTLGGLLIKNSKDGAGEGAYAKACQLGHKTACAYVREAADDQVPSLEIPTSAVASVKNCLRPFTKESPDVRRASGDNRGIDAHAPSEQSASKCRADKCPASSYVKAPVDTSTQSELHVISVYEAVQGTFPKSKFIGSQINVVIDPTSQPVNLALTSYESVVWHVIARPGAQVGKIFYGGYSKNSKVETEIPGVEIIAMGNVGFGYGWEAKENSGGGEFDKMIERVRAVAQADEVSYQGSYSGSAFQVPFLKSPKEGLKTEVQFAARSMIQKIEIPTEAEMNSTAALQFALSGNGIKDIATQKEYTVPSNYPALSSAMGFTYDSKRDRYLIVTLGGEGFAYAFTPKDKKWTVLSSMKNFDAGAALYDKGADRVWVVPKSMGEGTITWLRSYSSDFQDYHDLHLKQEISDIDHMNKMDLRLANGLLVLTSESRDHRREAPGGRGARHYAIDPKCGEVQEF